MTSTVKLDPPRACRSAAVTCQPLANPSTSCDCPSSTLWEPGGAPLAGVATALNPLLTLWPSTSSKGSEAPVTSAPWLSMCTEVAVTVGAAPGWVGLQLRRAGRGGEGSGPAPPPAAESRASWSMFQPVQVVGVLAHGGPCPAAVSHDVGPGARA